MWKGTQCDDLKDLGKKRKLYYNVWDEMSIANMSHLKTLNRCPDT